MRYDEMTGNWVVFAASRSSRPQQMPPARPATPLSDLPRVLPECPFCAGNEDQVPHTILALGDVDGHVACRVVPNKYPAVTPMGSQEVAAHHAYAETLLRDKLLLNNEIPAVGFHEVVVESPYHNTHIATSPGEHAELLLTAFRERGRELQEKEDIEHIMYFKNHGATAGASLVHPHSQILATPVVPITSQILQSNALAYFKSYRRSLYEQLVEEELHSYAADQDTSRIVDLTANYIAVVPFASPGPYAVTILPRFSSAEFTQTGDELLREAAHILRRCVRRIHLLLGEPAFNLVIQSAPLPGRSIQAAYQASSYFRWHIKIVPRLGAGAMAGFELGSGMFSNSHLPEHDAKALRSVAVSEHARSSK